MYGPYNRHCLHNDIIKFPKSTQILGHVLISIVSLFCFLEKGETTGFEVPFACVC